jgi:murein DD-endopeptidase MepM/ murein hydrolase activator NlpD
VAGRWGERRRGGGGWAWGVAALAALALVAARGAPGPVAARVRAAVAQAAGEPVGDPPRVLAWLRALQAFARAGLDGHGWRWPPVSGGSMVRTPPAPSPPMRYPVSGAILQPFGTGVDPLTGRQARMDGLLLGAVAGAAVVAPADGRIVAVRDGPPVGAEVEIAVAGRQGVTVSLLGVGDVAVRPGETVRRGQTLGRVPAAGPGGVAHLVMEVRVGGVPVDPLSPLFLGPPA